MILPVHTTLQTRIANVLTQHYGLDPATLPSIVIEYPPNRAMGDLAVTVAFELARTLRKPPRVIAQELVAALGTIDGLARITASPNGYVNFSLDRPAFVIRSLSTPGASGWGRGARDQGPGVGMPPDDGGPDTGGRPRPQPVTPDPERKTIVEHTAINPNKAAHIGHLRNATLGDTLVRLLRFRGVPVEIQNYIDDTGVQLADVVVGFRELESKGLDAIRQLADGPRFDYYCWDLYARVTTWYEADATRLKLRAAALRDLEHGDTDTAQLAHFIADRIVRRHLETMARMNVGYDLLTWEGDILRLRFWEQAFDILKRAGVVFLQTTGKLAGCWVMPIDEGRPGPAGGKSAGPRDSSAATSGVESAHEEESAESRAKIIVRSDGTVTYVGKDIAYQFWKFGLLGKDFYYRVFSRQENERPLWGDQCPARRRERCATTALIRRSQDRLQRHRYAAGLPSKAAAAGTRGHPVQDRGRALDPFLVRDGRFVTGYRTHARLRLESRRRPGIRGSLRAQGPRGESGRPARPLDGRCSRRSRQAESRPVDWGTHSYCRDDRNGGGAVLHDQVLAREGHHLRYRRGAEF